MYYNPPILWRNAAWLKLLSRFIGRSLTSSSKEGANKPENWRWPFRLTTSGDWRCCWPTSAGECNGSSGLRVPRYGRGGTRGRVCFLDNGRNLRDNEWQPRALRER